MRVRVLRRPESNCHADCFYINILILKPDFHISRKKETFTTEKKTIWLPKDIFLFKNHCAFSNNREILIFVNYWRIGSVTFVPHIYLHSCKVLFIQNEKRGPISMSVLFKGEKNGMTSITLFRIHIFICTSVTWGLPLRDGISMKLLISIL